MNRRTYDSALFHWYGSRSMRAAASPVRRRISHASLCSASTAWIPSSSGSLGAHHIPVTMIRMPTKHPPLEAGKAIAGMGTPDLRGAFGTFTFYTDDPEEISRNVSGGRIVKVPMFQNRAVLQVEGPVNSLRKDHRSSSVGLTVDVDPHDPAARLAIGD